MIVVWIAKRWHRLRVRIDNVRFGVHREDVRLFLRRLRARLGGVRTYVCDRCASTDYESAHLDELICRDGCEKPMRIMRVDEWHTPWGKEWMRVDNMRDDDDDNLIQIRGRLPLRLWEGPKK